MLLDCCSCNINEVFRILKIKDTPLALEKEFGGWLSPQMEIHFTRYAAVCFKAFGDRVKHWITINEPKTLALCGYCYGNHAPGR